MKVSRKIGIVISLQMGLVTGMTFTALSMFKQGGIHALVPIGILISGIVSMIISGVWGGIISMKDLSEGAAIRLFHLNPAKNKIAYNVVEAIVGDLAFTPILCTFFVIKNVGIHNPMFMKIWLSTLLLDFLICIPLNLVFCPIFKKIAGKIFGVSSIN
jgi:hypothetical protein